MKHSLSAIVLLVAVLLSACSAGNQVSTNAAPDETLEAFYDWYLGYARTTGNPLVDRAYAESDHLLDTFVMKVDDTLASFEEGGYDPILCAQDVPESVSISQVELGTDTATAQVTTSLGNSFQVQLVLLNGAWGISDIVCSR